jgi:hypothetical protein
MRLELRNLRGASKGNRAEHRVSVVPRLANGIFSKIHYGGMCEGEPGDGWGDQSFHNHRIASGNTALPWMSL